MVLLFNPEADDTTLKFMKAIFSLGSGANKPQFAKMSKSLRSHFADPNSPFVLKNKPRFGDAWKVPKIELVQTCLKKGSHESNNSFFPATYYPKSDKVTVCGNFIKSDEDLKEQVEREVLFANYLKTAQNENQSDRVIESYLRACRDSMDRYFSDQKLLAKSSQICAEYVVKYRDWNHEKLPHDRWLRFVGRKTAESAKTLFNP